MNLASPSVNSKVGSKLELGSGQTPHMYLQLFVPSLDSLCAGETLRAALNALTVVAPGWLQAQSQPEWVERYSERIEDYHLPSSKAGREQQAQYQVELQRTDSLQLAMAVKSRQGIRSR